jgi:hypothetical protein
MIGAMSANAVAPKAEQIDPKCAESDTQNHSRDGR